MIRTLLIINLCLVSLMVALLLFSEIETVSDLAEMDFGMMKNPEYQGVPENETLQNYMADFDLIVSKPLFHQARRVVEKKRIEKPEMIETRTVPISDFQLKGIVFAEDGKSVAYLINQRSEQEYGLTVNETVDGWKIREIFRNYVNLENGGQLARLNLINENQF